MQRLNTLWKMVNVATTVKDIANHTRTFQFKVVPPVTFYLMADNATVQISRWHRPQIEVTTTLQNAFGWRLATDQDEAGVYIAAKRLPVVGGLSSASFEVLLPYNTYLVTRLSEGALFLDNVNGTLHIPPPTDSETDVHLLREKKF